MSYISFQTYKHFKVMSAIRIITFLHCTFFRNLQGRARKHTTKVVSKENAMTSNVHLWHGCVSSPHFFLRPATSNKQEIVKPNSKAMLPNVHPITSSKCPFAMKSIKCRCSNRIYCRASHKQESTMQ